MNFSTLHDILLSVCILTLVVLLLVFLLKRFNQPYLIAYILAGLVLGPFLSGTFGNTRDIQTFGEIGILLHFFFMGTEVEVPDSHQKLIRPIVAQVTKSLLSVLVAVIVGARLNWSTEQITVLAFIMMMNSTAVVSEYLRKTGELHMPLGKFTLTILVLQDIFFTPAIASLQFMGHQPVSFFKVFSSIVVCVLVYVLFRTIRKRDLIRLPFTKAMEADHDLQVFIGLLICFGTALLFSWFGLTESFGVFVAGVIIARTDSFHWLEKTLRPFKEFFMCLFFLSVGMMIDLDFMVKNYRLVLGISLAVLVINSVIAAIVFRLQGFTWRLSLYSGALLSQTGEYSLLLGSLAWRFGIIDEGFYKIIIIITSLTLLFSTAWITILRAFIHKEKSHTRDMVLTLLKSIKAGNHA
ncbi:MAG: cation:proton antiporter [Chryseosolibacter sp.]